MRLGKLPKWTTPFHIIAGFITVLAGIYISWCLTGLLFLAFLLIENLVALSNKKRSLVFQVKAKRIQELEGLLRNQGQLL